MPYVPPDPVVASPVINPPANTSTGGGGSSPIPEIDQGGALSDLPIPIDLLHLFGEWGYCSKETVCTNPSGTKLYAGELY